MTLETIIPVTHDLGDFKVRRTLPAKTHTMTGPFIFVDQFCPARLPAGHGIDVRPHTHINPSTVSYLLEGCQSNTAIQLAAMRLSNPVRST